ncbi:MAG: hypothetical protein RLZZ196_220 [Bacteroidota bacterium]|jgi:hypothetical protein
MKSFKTYLTENHRTYDFRIRIAGELPKDFDDKLKSAYDAYKVNSVKRIKRLPIQESPMFPNQGPVEVNVVDVNLQYPCNDIQLLTLLSERIKMDQCCIRVTPANSPYEAALEGLEVSNKDGQVVLSNNDMKAETPEKDLVGDARIPNLIKELEETRKYEYPEAAGGKTAAGKNSNTLPQGNMSPIGSRQNKIPNPVKG